MGGGGETGGGTPCPWRRPTASAGSQSPSGPPAERPASGRRGRASQGEFFRGQARPRTGNQARVRYRRRLGPRPPVRPSPRAAGPAGDSSQSRRTPCRPASSRIPVPGARARTRHAGAAPPPAGASDLVIQHPHRHHKHPSSPRPPPGSARCIASCAGSEPTAVGPSQAAVTKRSTAATCRPRSTP